MSILVASDPDPVPNVLILNTAYHEECVRTLRRQAFWRATQVMAS
jgi:hypothetical protein